MDAKSFTVFMSNTLMKKFWYTPDQEDASDAPFTSFLCEADHVE